MLQKIHAYFSFLILLALVTSSSFAQYSSNYVFNAATDASLTDMSSGTTDILIPTSVSGDFASTVQNIGFNFTLMGTTYTQFSANTNGLMRLGGTAVTTAFTNDLLSTTNIPQLAPFWDDHNQALSTTKVHMKVTGSPGSQVLTVEWKDFVIRFNSSSTTELSTWQARLYEATGVIEFVYGAMQIATGSSTVTASIGFSVANANDKVLSVTSITTPAVATTTAGVVNNLINSSTVGTITGLHSTVDGSRVMYSFTPQSGLPADPITMTFTSVTSTGMTVNWVDNSTAETYFSVYRSSDGVNYSFIGDIASTTIAGTGSGYSSVQSGLLPGQTYHFRITASNEGTGTSGFLSGSQATTAAGTIVSTGSGNWSSTVPDAPWPGGVIPIASDNVTIADGHTVTLDAAGLVCNNLTVGQGVSGVLEYQATPLAGLTVNGNLTVAAGGTFTAGLGTLTTHTLGIGSNTGTEALSGSLINNGVLDLNGSAGVTTTFFGNQDESISGTGATTDFYAIIVNKGTSQSAVLDVTIPITMSAPSASGTRLTITNGTFKMSSASTLTPWFASQTICATTGRLWLNNASAVMTSVGVGTTTGAGSPTFNGELRIDDGTFSYGSGNNNFDFSSSSGAMGTLRMSGGILNVFGRITFASNSLVQFIMSGGNINVDPQAGNNLATGSSMFSIGISTTVNWSGGIVTLVDPTSAAGNTAFSNSFGVNKIITGGKLRIGDGVSTTSGGTLSTTSGFGISATGGIWDLEIDNRTDASTSRMARLTGEVDVLNQLEIKANGYLFMGSSSTGQFLVNLGNVINDGTLAGTHPTGTAFLGTFYFFGDSPQSVSGNGTFTNIPTLSIDKADVILARENSEPNYNLDLEAANEHSPLFKIRESDIRSGTVATLTFSNTNSLVVNRINAFVGTANLGGNVVVGRSTTIPIIQVGSGLATLPGGSFTTVPVFDNTFGPSTYFYSIALGAHTMGAYNEMPAGPQTLTQLLINDEDGLTLDRAITVNTTLSLSDGKITTTDSNLLTFNATTTLNGSDTSYVNGPFARQIAASTVSGTTLNFPIGKGSLNSLALVDPNTSAGGPVVVKAEVFDATSGGTAGTGLISLNTNRYWNAEITSGATEFLSTKVRLTETGLTGTMGIGKSATQTGTYNLVSSIAPAGGTVTTDSMISLSFYAIGERELVANPTGVSATAVSPSQINIAFTQNGASDTVLIVSNTTGIFSGPSYPIPAVGQPFAGGTLLFNGTGSSYNDTGLLENTKYYYKLFSIHHPDFSIGVDVNATTFAGLPYTQDYEGTFPPSGWSRYTGLLLSPSTLTPVASGWVQDDWRNVTSPVDKAAKLNIWTTTVNHWFVTPLFDLGPGSTDYQFEFNLTLNAFGTSSPPGTSGVDDKFAIVISTDGGTTWSSANTLRLYDNAGSSFVYNSINPAGEHVTLDLSAYSGVVQFGFYGESTVSNADNDLMIDDILVQEIPTAPIFSVSPLSKDFGNILAGNTSAPQNFIITNIGAGTLTINSGGVTLTGTNADQFVLETVTYPINLTNGQSDTVRVSFAPTSAGSKTANLEIVHNATETTAIVPLSGSALPAGVLFEDFTGTIFPPPGWLAINNDAGTKNWVRNTGKFNSAPASASSSWESSVIPNNDWLITPKLSVATGDFLSFYHSSNGFDEILVVKIGLTNDPNGIWTNLDSLIDDTPTVWTFESYDLSAFNGQEVYIAFVNRGLDQFTLYIDDVTGPMVFVPANDIGIVAYNDGPTTESIVTTGLTREYLIKDPEAIYKKENISISVKTNGNNTESAPMNFEVIVQNFGTSVENSYQVGWEIDGSLQTSVSNTEPLEVGDVDTLTLTWAVPVEGVHTTRAWTILAGDVNASNDTSGTISFYVAPENSIFLENFEDLGTTFPPAGWMVINRDGGGSIGPWFPGNPANFTAYVGDGYITDGWASANGFYIDDYLITPNTGGLLDGTTVDSLVFWLNSPGDPYRDSLEIRISTTGTDTADFTILLEYVQAPDTWTRFAYELPNAANRYIAFRYLHYDGGISGGSSNIIGLDLVEIHRHTMGGSTFNLTVDVADGWNMVSIPGLRPDSQHVNVWWAFRDMSASVFKFDNGYAAITNAVPGEGYWMKHSGPLTYNTGDEWPAINIVANDPIDAVTGWNMIGPYENPAVVSGITTTPSGLIEGSIFGYSNGYFAEDTLKPGYGYWIKLSGDGTVNMPSALSKSTSKIASLINKDWGRIIITDASGKGYTLYATEGEVNLNVYDLPPAPPAGVFDVRYSSGRYAEELNEKSQQIDMNGLVYPIKVKAEGISIRLQDLTGKIVNERLKEGEEVTISQNNISKLIASKDIIPDKYALEQNYPNPFNPSTVIEFSIPENAKNVKLTIYNALGERVAELINGSFEPGIYQYQWNAVNSASGLYIYELRTEKFVSVKKMMLLK